MKSLRRKKQSAFTLIEMVIVLFIISLLLLIIIPNINSQKNSAKNKTDAAFKTTLQTQVDMYDGDNPTWGKLQSDNYLSSAQVNKAQKEGYAIENGTVVGPKK
ncbi:competence type IV pilus major pilin ComGC [Bombilactobacillus thymidiniphilus]|uniref:Prepilin-type N-terminal cleavage/methylation domain-containing protein n=1 Tax=Bombilactobacillus thymidiniphilus TaxID=2923363 RepID=A0ABY4PDP8_9LACO|nr:competence type IV pilus major pilin ComGC [Bombilactobacillus thymidiniphilus]UQS83804.1 prepilin-type N-terminal cleavage/methylation domain-containing protein [Bombilactobacillus thymidiniphilus]